MKGTLILKGPIYVKKGHTEPKGPKHVKKSMAGCVAQLSECRSLAGELTLSYARPAADG